MARKERAFVRLPIGLLLFHEERVRNEAKTKGEDPDKQVGQWCWAMAMSIATGQMSGDPFLEELEDFMEFRSFGGAPVGNQNARKQRRTRRASAKGMEDGQQEND